MRKLSLTLVGGFCGAIARFALGAPLLALTAALPGARASFPYDTLFINLSGALALGILFGLFEHGAPVPSEARLVVGAGFLGAYTTFSSYVVGADELFRRGDALASGIYLIGSMVGGVVLAFSGFWFAGAFWRRWRQWRVARRSAAMVSAGQDTSETAWRQRHHRNRARVGMSAVADEWYPQ